MTFFAFIHKKDSCFVLFSKNGVYTFIEEERCGKTERKEGKSTFFSRLIHRQNDES